MIDIYTAAVAANLNHAAPVRASNNDSVWGLARLIAGFIVLLFVHGNLTCY